MQRRCGSRHPLPRPLAEEPARFAAVVDALHDQWHHDLAEKGLAEATEATLPWVPVVKA